jgi:prepilin-type N-terminal cleavage/methylation domain-containing protein
MNHRHRQAGFTLLEIVVGIAIIAVLAAIAIPAYRHYLVRAHAAELVEDYEAIKKLTALSYDGTKSCQDYVNTLDPKFFKNEYASLDIGFQDAPNGGHTPFFRVCSQVGKQGKMGVEVAAHAYKMFQNIDAMDKGAVVGQALVAFAAPLTPPGTSVCDDLKPTTTATAKGCGGSGGLQPALAAQTQNPAPPSQPPSPPSPPPPPPAPKLPDTTIDGTKCKPWEYADGKNCRLRPEYANLTITKKPSKADNPCPDGYYFHPKNGQAYSGGSQDGQCVSAGNHQDPYEPVRCTVSKPGLPPALGERLHMEKDCEYPNNFCITKFTNHDTGAREIVRRCGNRQEATMEWYYGTSDSDKCQTFDPKFVLTLDYECLYACVKDGCNSQPNPISVDKKAMWTP